jgi:hypothetical protein
MRIPRYLKKCNRFQDAPIGCIVCIYIWDIKGDIIDVITLFI